MVVSAPRHSLRKIPSISSRSVIVSAWRGPMNKVAPPRNSDSNCPVLLAAVRGGLAFMVSCLLPLARPAATGWMVIFDRTVARCEPPGNVAED